MHDYIIGQVNPGINQKVCIMYYKKWANMQFIVNTKECRVWVCIKVMCC